MTFSNPNSNPNPNPDRLTFLGLLSRVMEHTYILKPELQRCRLHGNGLAHVAALGQGPWRHVTSASRLAWISSFECVDSFWVRKAAVSGHNSLKSPHSASEASATVAAAGLSRLLLM